MGNVDTLEKIKLRIRWQTVKEHYPPRGDCKFYGDRHSVPVLAGNFVTGQVAERAYIWDYDCEEWRDSELDLESEDLEMHITHWALWPKCNLVCLD